ncbi:MULTISPECIES: winged helix-turn-helix domain-containing protein [unclassified Archaeoglobus]|jgi:predicted transcriptional regulator|uniref:winged helix-turn-helix domain-containing protein n=1 Tax=unclassified Archaeoglobus TaxID=2643606 RepID=UPI0025C21126|nr:winged helix-turn-helix domain-containing protein [Archaeoglobus sp. UBA230]
MPRKREHLLDFLDFVSFKLLSELKGSPKTFTELFNVSGLSKRNFDRRIKELIELKLVDEVLIPDPKTGRKKKRYTLTDFGRFVLEKLEEIEEYPKR